MRHIIFFSICACFISEAQANILRVPQEYATIQAAVDASTESDTVLVDAGLYSENVYIDKGIHLIASSSNGDVIIQDPGQSAGPFSSFVIYIDAPVAGKISGFDIVGTSEVNGAGVWVNQGDWQISNCRVSLNYIGIYMQVAARITENVIEQNVEGGVVARGGSTILNNVIVSTFTGIVIDNDNNVNGSSDLIANNLIANVFFGFKMGAASAIVVNNVLTTFGYSNEGSQQGSAWVNLDSEGLLQNNVIAYSGRDGIFTLSGGQNPTPVIDIRYNDVFGNEPDYGQLVPNLTGEEGNISVPPLFSDNFGEFYLASDSPLIDAGAPSVIDLDGTRSDMGMYGGPHAKEIRYAPASFDLITPFDSVTVGEHVNFEWGASFDKDLGDEITYRLLLAQELIPCYPYAKAFTFCLGGDIDTLQTNSNTLSTEIPLSDTNNYYWTVEAVDRSGLFKQANTIRHFMLDRNTKVENPELESPLGFHHTSPNPFTDKTNISFTLSRPAYVTVETFDIYGRRVATLVSDYLASGAHEYVWQAETIASGVYVCRLQVENTVASIKVVHLR